LRLGKRLPAHRSRTKPDHSFANHWIVHAGFRKLALPRAEIAPRSARALYPRAGLRPPKIAGSGSRFSTRLLTTRSPIPEPHSRMVQIEARAAFASSLEKPAGASAAALSPITIVSTAPPCESPSSGRQSARVTLPCLQRASRDGGRKRSNGKENQQRINWKTKSWLDDRQP
jgi:hypothetical protein